MHSIGNILPTVINKRQLTPQSNASQVLEAAEQYLQEIFGKDNIGRGKKISARKLQKGLLFFEVSSSAWNHRLFLEKMELLNFLQGKFPDITIEDIRGRVE